LQRIGQPDDIGAAVRFLLGPQSGWMTGQTLVVDGGHTLTLAAARDWLT
jgi:3-oxoacyl-[acyl-carrier protein] reductase